MISQNPFGEYDETTRNISDRKIKDFYGISPEVFYGLPYEVQNVLLNNYWELVDTYHYGKTSGEDMPKGESHNTKLDNLRKRMALKQYEFEENIKVKILTIFKKNK
jgi:hypothetical protein